MSKVSTKRKKADKKPKETKRPIQATFGPRLRHPKPLIGSILILLACLYSVALIDYRFNQKGLFEGIARVTHRFGDPNLVGQFGADLGFLALHYLGLIAFAVGLILLQFGLLLFFRRPKQISLLRLLGAVLLIIGGCGFAELLNVHSLSEFDQRFPRQYLTNDMGGLLGQIAYGNYFQNPLGVFGSATIMLVSFLLGIGLVFQEVVRSIAWLFSKIRLPKLPERKPRSPIEKPVLLEDEEPALPFFMRLKRGPLKPFFGKSVNENESEPSPLQMDYPESHLPKIKVPEPDPQEEVVETPKPKATPKIRIPTPKAGEKKEQVKIVSSAKVEKNTGTTPVRKGKYKFPSIDLLEESGASLQHGATDHQQIAESLKSTLEDFNIKVSVGEVHIGPVITRYDLHPAPGVRVEKIAGLEKNLTMALRAQSVRILAPVPGKGVVGIEIPNEHPQSVRVRDILETNVWADSKAEIPIVLGKEVSGKPLVADLTRMPHLLIAGSTGSGKTVCINAIISSLLYHSSPDDLRFIMVDPKIVEMQIFNDLPHMLIPVVTDPKKVPNALKWLISEMERRYQIFAQVGVRNIAGFNAKILRNQESKELAKNLDKELTAEERAAVNNIAVPRDENVLEIPEKKLPYIVCIIDELADLMMVAPADIETCVARLAQLARAAGIHLVIATQRPSVNVITGVIKANLPSRISFKVASKVDSRTILDGGGADTLIGKGDMLFIPPGVHHLIRAQGAFVSDDEINDIVEFLKVNGPPQIAEEIQRQVESGDDDEEASFGPDGEDWGDSLVPDAIEVIRSSKRASTSMLQRRLRIGYNRAARIMEILEERGLVGPDNGSQPREILQDLDSL